MAKPIKTSADLNKLMEDIARDVLEKVSEEVLKIFQDEYIMKYVYQPNDPKVYKRTYQFLKSWRFTEIKKLANSLETTLSSDKGLMDSYPLTYVHSAYSPFGKDTRMELERYLNKDGRSSGHFWSRKNGKAYWDKFLDGFFESGKLRKIIDKHAKSSGLVVVTSAF